MSIYSERRVREAKRFTIIGLCASIVVVPLAVFVPDALPYMFIFMILLGLLTLWLIPRDDEKENKS